MSDKPFAMFAAALAVPICAVCVLGPVFVFTTVSGWIGGLDPGLAIGLAVIAAILVTGAIKRGMGKRPPNVIEITNED